MSNPPPNKNDQPEPKSWREERWERRQARRAREDKGQHYVFVYADNKVHRRDIAVGVASASKYEVMSGLGPDDRVALPGVEELTDGMEVRAGEAN